MRSFAGMFGMFAGMFAEKKKIPQGTQRTFAQLTVGFLLMLLFSIGFADPVSEVKARWCRPDTGGPVSEYQLEVLKGGTLEFEVSTADTFYVWPITDFEFGPEYTARVRGQNEFGSGPWTDWSDPLTLEGPPGSGCDVGWQLQ